MWWRVACAFAVVAAISVVALAWRLARPAPATAVVEVPASASIDDQRVTAPEGWESWPVVAHFESPREVRSSDGLFGRTADYRAKLGPLVVAWTEEHCTAGGSACGPYIPKWRALAAGDPGDDGAPLLGASVDCDGTTPWESVSNTPKKRSCSLESIVLRRSADGRIFVVSFRDPDDTDRLVAAFVRTSVHPSLGTARGRSSLAFALFPVVVFAAGIVLLARARRHHRAAFPGGEPPHAGSVYRETEPATEDALQAHARRRMVLLAAMAILALATSTLAATTMILSSS